jgi:hypothetical protein
MVELLEEDQEEFLLNLQEIHTLEETDIPDANLARRARGLDEEHIENFVHSDWHTWPPILVTRTDKGYILLDGYHRREATRRRKLMNIKTTCRTFKTQEDVIEAVFRANLTHGKPASAESRSDYAYWLWKTYPHLKHKEIALRCGISRSAVSHAVGRKEEKKTQVTIEKAKRDAKIPQLILPGTQPEEEQRQQKILACSQALSSNSYNLSQYLSQVYWEQRKTRRLVETLEIVRRSLLQSCHLTRFLAKEG